MISSCIFNFQRFVDIMRIIFVDSSLSVSYLRSCLIRAFKQGFQYCDEWTKMVNWTQLTGLRPPARCLGGHGFDSCRGLRYFLCPTLVSNWSVHFFIFNIIWRNFNFWSCTSGWIFWKEKYQNVSSLFRKWKIQLFLI